MNTAVQLLAASVGTVGFGLLFHVPRRQMIFAALGGFLCWAIYLGAESLIDNLFLCAFASSFGIALYAEILARVIKAPSTPFFAISVIPLIPGGGLYHTMAAFFEGENESAALYGSQTFFTALGIAAGMSLMWAFCDLSRKIHRLIFSRRKTDRR